MIQKACFAIAITILMMPVAHSGEPILVLGLPLGGKLPKQPKECKLSELGGTPRESCWVSPPFVQKDGARFGNIEVANRQSRPIWAENGTFEFELSKDRTLERILVRTFNSAGKYDIDKSISSRFGQPTEPRNIGPRSYSATWNLPAIYIHMSCSDPDYCRVEFATAAARDAHQRELAARAKAAAARPTSP